MPNFWSKQVLTSFQIAAWSQVGVLVRLYLDLFFTNGCNGAWGVCLLSQGGAHKTFGAYFPDLAANMLGSFVMGLLTSASAHRGDSKRAVAILPETHAWQDAPELLVGLRTGFCGSLTTFASWELSLVTLLIGGRGIQGGQWAEFLWGLIIGFQLALSSYMFGVHLAANLAAFFTAAGSSKGPREQENRQQRPEEKPALGDKPGESRGSGGVSSQQSGQTPGSAGWDVEERGQLGAGIFRAAGRSDGQDRTETETKSPLQSKLSPHYRKTDLAVLLMVSLLTALWIVLAIVDSHAQHANRRRQWFALLFAPFGALLRWKLALLNGKLSMSPWFPAGTLAANLLACCIDFGTQAGLQRMTSPGYWVTLLLKAVQTGFSGSLSTVSTFVAEVHKMPGENADNVHGYIYGLLSICLGALSGIIIYGWSVWT